MSEPETQAIVRYYRSLPAVVGAIDFHSYSEYVLRPYGDSTQQAPDEAQFAAAGDAVVAAIERAGGPRYQSLNAMSGLYPTTGIAGDFFYGRDPTAPKGSGPMRGGHYAYGLSIELSPAHDGGTAGFVLDPSHIEPVGKQMLAALSAFTSHVTQNPL
ncbi:Zn-dependent exopeptidase [Ramicandelaber brevisporus]|nr:Zn-dependent exopeptidase [Ramicandelaber brevisporus]